ncbi:MAG: hypothetical protein D6698_00970 [Gammaproteobacteria bacterium]|nr:MAG: hypothetical protein D6698_00970 [Gammaproteobacteria bacterium]
MLSVPAIVASLTYLLMCVAYRFHAMRRFHGPVMASIILFDLAMPFYLYLTRDWYQRLIVDGDILSFLLWMHLGLIMTLYTFYVLQVSSAIRLWKNDNEPRSSHAAFAKGILIVRALVILTGWLLAE